MKLLLEKVEVYCDPCVDNVAVIHVSYAPMGSKYPEYIYWTFKKSVDILTLYEDGDDPRAHDTTACKRCPVYTIASMFANSPLQLVCRSSARPAQRHHNTPSEDRTIPCMHSDCCCSFYK